MSGIIDNLTSAINTWNSKLAEIWLLLTESPETFKGGNIWQIIVKIHGALQAIGLALLVLFFVWGLIKTCTSWQDVKRPEQAFKLLVYAFGFSQLSTKYETTKPPAMRVVSNKVIQNNHHSFYNEGVQAIKIRKNGDYNG